MSEQLAAQSQRRSKELTPIQRLVMRELRVRGNTHQRIAKSMKVSLQTVHAQTTTLGIKPAGNESERSLQLDLMRRRLALESGLDFDDDIGEMLWKIIHPAVTKLVDSFVI